MRSYEFSAKTVDKAIKEGLETLGKKQEDVDIKIISEGGFLKKAKIVINIEDESDFNTSFTRKDDVKKEELNVEEKPLQEGKEETAKEENVENLEKKYENVEESRDKQEVENKKTEVEVAFEETIVETTTVIEEKPEENKNNKKGKKPKYEVPTQEELEEKRRKFAEKHFENNQTSVEFVQGLVDAMKLDAKVSLEEKRDSSNILIETEDAGKVIGYRGDCLSAIQYLANIVEGNVNPNAKRVVVDSGDYKQKREDVLRNLAIRVASKVESTGRPYKLEPMNAFERRIVHTELQNYPSVETHSEGIEPHRRIVVTRKK